MACRAGQLGARRTAPDHACALHGNHLQLFVKEPQEPKGWIRVYKVLLVKDGVLKEQREVQVHKRANLQLHLTIVSDSLRVLDTVCGVEDFEMHICGQVRGSQFLSQEGCRGSTRAGAEKKNL
ncbi:uncharacterized [Tachysurus ichikawai]